MHRRPSLLAASAAAAFVVLALLVAAGVFRHADQHAVSHWMPWLAPGRHGTSIGSLTLPRTKHTLGGTLLDLWEYPAAVLPSGLVVLAAALALRGRGRPRAAAAWLAAWVAGNAVEVAGKAIVERPALYDGALHVTGFDHSYPSGHAMRALLLAAAVAAVWPRARRVVLWALTIPVDLVVLGDHTPTDVAGGLLVAVALVAGVQAVTAART